MATTQELEERLEALEAQVRQNVDYAAHHGEEHFFEGRDPAVPHIAVRKNTARLTSPARYASPPSGTALPAEVGRRPRLNFIEGGGIVLTIVDDSAEDEIDITIGNTTGGAFGSCYDIIVMALYTGTEGASITIPNSTHEVFFFSTWGGAATKAATLGRSASIGVCPGEYRETVIFTTEVYITGLTEVPFRDSFSGSGSDDIARSYAYLNPSSTQTASTIDFQGPGVVVLTNTMKNIVIKSRDSQFAVEVSENGCTLALESINFNGDAKGIEWPSIEASFPFKIHHCYFDNLDPAINGDANDREMSITDCFFTDCGNAIEVGQGSLIDGNHFTSNTIDILLDDAANDVKISNNLSASAGHFIKHKGGVLGNRQVIVKDNHASNLGTAFADFASMSANKNSGAIVLEGNSGSVSDGGTVLVLGSGIQGLTAKHNRFSVHTTGSITWKTGGGHPSNHYEDNQVELSTTANSFSATPQEGAHGEKLQADLFAVTTAIPFTIGWAAFAVEWDQTVVDYAASTKELSIGTNKVYLLDDGTVNSTLSGWPIANHKKMAEYVLVNSSGSPAYSSHTIFAPLLFTAHAPAASGSVPNDTVDAILYDNGAISLGINAFITREDNVINSISATTFNLTDNATNFVEVVGTSVSANTTSFTLGRIALGTVVTSGNDITSITEQAATLDQQSALADADGDTSVETEATSDADQVEQKVAGNIRSVLKDSSPHLAITGDQDISGHQAVGGNASISANELLSVNETISNAANSSAQFGGRVNLTGSGTGTSRTLVGIEGAVASALSSKPSLVAGLQYGAVLALSAGATEMDVMRLTLLTSGAASGTVDDAFLIKLSTAHAAGTAVATRLTGLHVPDLTATGWVPTSSETAYGVQIDAFDLDTDPTRRPIWYGDTGSGLWYLDEAGRMWLRETTAPTQVSNLVSVYAKDSGGVSKIYAIDDAGDEAQLNHIHELTITVEDPTSGEDIGVHFFKRAVTILAVEAVVVGSSTPSVTIEPKHSTDRSAAGNDILSSPTAITNTTTGQTLTGFDDATVPATSHYWLETTAKSGVVDEVKITIRYTFD